MRVRDSITGTPPKDPSHSFSWPDRMANIASRRSSAGFSGISLFAITGYCFGGRVVDAVNTQLILLDLFGSCQEFVGGTRRRRGGRSLGIWKRNTSILRELCVKTGSGRRNWLRLDVILRDTQSPSRVRDRAPRGRRWICRSREMRLRRVTER
jgi:hypothetical protein